MSWETDFKEEDIYGAIGDYALELAGNQLT